MELHNSFEGTMKVTILHGSSSKFIFKLERNYVLSNSKFELKILPVTRFSRTYAY
jgi:hypothetical protein